MRSIVSLIFLLSVVPAFGAETPWEEIAPRVEMRLISDGQVDAEGRTLAGLELKMPPSTNTYWRVPGQAGFVAQFDFGASEAVANAEVLWPFPERKFIGPLMDYVYHGDLVVPIEVQTSGQPAILNLEVVLGICEEICIPAQASFSLELHSDSYDRANGTRLKQALAEVPIAWNLDHAAYSSVMLSEDRRRILVTGLASEIDPDSLILDMGTTGPLFGAPQKSLGEALVELPILTKSDNSDLAGQSVEMTFMTDQGAYAVRGSIEPFTD